MSSISRLISSIISVLCEWLFGRHKVTLELPVCISFLWRRRCLGIPYHSGTNVTHTSSPSKWFRSTPRGQLLITFIGSLSASVSRSLLETDRERYNFPVSLKKTSVCFVLQTLSNQSFCIPPLILISPHHLKSRRKRYTPEDKYQGLFFRAKVKMFNFL